MARYHITGNVPLQPERTVPAVLFLYKFYCMSAICGYCIGSNSEGCARQSTTNVRLVNCHFCQIERYGFSLLYDKSRCCYLWRRIWRIIVYNDQIRSERESKCKISTRTRSGSFRFKLRRIRRSLWFWIMMNDCNSHMLHKDICQHVLLT